jgi:hypothetical protein
LSIWPPSQRARDVVMHRHVQMLATPNSVSQCYDTGARGQAASESMTPQVFNDRINWVKPANIGQTMVNLGHHLKNESTIPNDPLDQVNTHLWSTLGQNPGQTPMSLNSLRNFCHILQISPKHFGFSQYKSCPVFRGTQLCFRVAFQILSGKGWKSLVNAFNHYSSALRKL